MLYQLEPFFPAEESVSIKDNRKIIMRYFIRDIEEEVFMNAGKVQFIANEGYNPQVLQETDFLYADFDLLVFSSTAYHAIHEQIKENVVFHPCDVLYKENTFSFHVGKIVTSRPIIDSQKSTYRTLFDGTETLFGAVFRDNLVEDFFIAKDTGINYRYAASEKFIELIKANNLKINAIPRPTSLEDLLIK